MADDKTSKSTPAGLYLATHGQSTQAIEWLGVALAILWLCVSGYILMMPIEGNANMLASMLIVFMPVAILWLAVIVIRTSQKMRQESHKLHVAIEALRKACINQSKMNGAPATEASVTRKLDSIAESQRKTETAIAMFTSTRLAEAQNAAIPNTAQPQAEHQPVLALGTPVEELAPPLAKPDFIRALNFPENANDEEGFNALRRALKDRSVAQLVQASQDILTLLSQDGIYMDDLRPDMARPEIWRRFAKGERGRTIAALGGIRDRSSLALTNVRMKKDPVFRDAAHHFLRLFDRGFSKFEESATETEISALSETRTARAFMLLGRVAGTFD